MSGAAVPATGAASKAQEMSFIERNHLLQRFSERLAEATQVDIAIAWAMPVGVGACALTEAMALLQGRLASADS